MKTVTGTTPGLFDVESSGGCGICNGCSSGSSICCSCCRVLCCCKSCWYCTYTRISIQRPKSLIYGKQGLTRGGVKLPPAAEVTSLSRSVIVYTLEPKCERIVQLQYLAMIYDKSPSTHSHGSQMCWAEQKARRRMCGYGKGG